MKSTCLICEIEFADAAEEIPQFDKIPCGVCPTCHKAAEIGRRVMGMKERNTGRNPDYDCGWNDFLREAKGE